MLCSKNDTAFHSTCSIFPDFFFPAKHLAVVVVSALMEDVRLHESFSD